MPTVEIEGFKFRFYASDIGEPPHVHVRKDRSEAVWLEPLRLDHNHGYNEKNLLRLLRLAAENRQRLLDEWNGYFSR